MKNRPLILLITVLAALALGVGGMWLTGDVYVLSPLAVALGLFVWGLVRYFDWRMRFRRRILGDADSAPRTCRRCPS